MATQATALAPAEHAVLTKALSLKGEINALHREALKSGNEMMRNAIRCGELLEEVKGVLKAAKSATFENWIERNLDFSPQSARSYMRLYNELGRLSKTKAAFVLKNADSISEARRLISSALPEPEEKEPVMPAPKPLKPERILPAPDIEPRFTAPEEPVDNNPVEPARCDDPLPEPEKLSERHSPTPWAPFGRQVIDANQKIIAQCKTEEDAKRITECVNAMAGVHDPKAVGQWLKQPNLR